ncbi:hypothetical protein BSKO_10093 [Bryopsis sp. KO-2023]|nr:hypothetical protein BSKO_10093 [Bryopsis sp. KO-2023]
MKDVPPVKTRNLQDRFQAGEEEEGGVLCLENLEQVEGVEGEAKVGRALEKVVVALKEAEGVEVAVRNLEKRVLVGEVVGEAAVVEVGAAVVKQSRHLIMYPKGVANRLQGLVVEVQLLMEEVVVEVVEEKKGEVVAEVEEGLTLAVVIQGKVVALGDLPAHLGVVEAEAGAREEEDILKQVLEVVVMDKALILKGVEVGARLEEEVLVQEVILVEKDQGLSLSRQVQLQVVAEVAGPDHLVGVVEEEGEQVVVVIPHKVGVVEEEVAEVRKIVKIHAPLPLLWGAVAGVGEEGLLVGGAEAALGEDQLEEQEVDWVLAMMEGVEVGVGVAHQAEEEVGEVVGVPKQGAGVETEAVLKVVAGMEAGQDTADMADIIMTLQPQRPVEVKVEEVAMGVAMEELAEQELEEEGEGVEVEVVRDTLAQLEEGEEGGAEVVVGVDGKDMMELEVRHGGEPREQEEVVEVEEGGAEVHVLEAIAGEGVEEVAVGEEEVEEGAGEVPQGVGMENGLGEVVGEVGGVEGVEEEVAEEIGPLSKKNAGVAMGWGRGMGRGEAHATASAEMVLTRFLSVTLQGGGGLTGSGNQMVLVLARTSLSLMFPIGSHRLTIEGTAHLGRRIQTVKRETIKIRFRVQVGLNEDGQLMTANGGGMLTKKACFGSGRRCSEDSSLFNMDRETDGGKEYLWLPKESSESLSFSLKFHSTDEEIR